MSTRADFYIGRGEDAIWLGSIAADGEGEWLVPTNPQWRDYLMLPADERIGERPEAYVAVPFDENPLVLAITHDEYIAAALALIDGRDDGTPAQLGWPWPWKDSSTSSYAYAFDEGDLHVSKYGGPWHQLHKGESCPAEPILETLYAAQSELLAEARREARIQGTSQLTMTDALLAAKAEVAQAQAILDALDMPTFPDMTQRKDVAWGTRSGLMVLCGPLATLGCSPHES